MHSILDIAVAILVVRRLAICSEKTRLVFSKRGTKLVEKRVEIVEEPVKEAEEFRR